MLTEDRTKTKHMRKITTFILTILLYSYSYGQTVTELYNNKNYQELVKLETKTDKLTADELYMVGFAFFQLENDNKAIEFYDKAISKGLDNGSVYFYKSVSYYYSKKYDEALKQIDIALQKEPTNQEFMNHKGQIYRLQGQEDKALEFFTAATKLPNTFGEPFFWVAYIYHGKQDFKKALSLYYIALDSVPKENSYYKETLESIGKLEYSYTKDYSKSANAYSQAIQLDKDNYELYYKLMKSHNAAKEYVKADSIFGLVKIAFEKGILPKEDMEIKTIAIAQFEWNGQIATIRKSLIDPKESLDISYKVFLLNKEGDKVERRFVVEKTIQLEKDGAKHLLCEQDKKTGDHITYPYGWSKDNIPLDDLEKAVKLVLDGKMKYSAKSNFGKK
jgi:tetratricopeptide (TPR) repeat protein